VSANDLVQALVARTAQLLPARQRFPSSTYRLQFNPGFTFRDAHNIVPYLWELGISDCYASPYLTARPGSAHGYDISDHNQLNPEIGTEEEYDAWIDALHERGMGQIFDMVPNHMGIVGNRNAWWNDILENGPSSPYAGFFDIDWYSSLKPELHHKVLLPVLGDPYGKVLESRQLLLAYDGGAFSVAYFDHRFPLEPTSYARVLGHRLGELEQEQGATSEAFVEYQSILTALGHLPPFTSTEPQKSAERQREKAVIKKRLATLTAANAAVRAFVEANVNLFNGGNGDARSFDLLDDLLNHQAYRLCFWRVASDEINYRRFFDINELAALSMEKIEVFEATHQFVLRLIAEGKINGLRIDHVDGLFDPREYLERLQEYYVLELARRIAETEPEFQGLNWADSKAEVKAAFASADQAPLLRGALYVLIEKILGREEPLPEEWATHGTTGYEFLNWVNGLFVAPENASALTRLYQRFSHNTAPFPDIVYNKKFLIMQVAMSSELHMLAHQLNQLSERNRWSRDFTLNSHRHALREITACFPVYRPYIRCGREILERDRYYVETAVALARRRNPVLTPSLFDFVRNMILLQYQGGASEAEQEEQCRFVGKFQQFTAPVMAKGLEDTAFYVYNRLVSLNEVGGDPGQFGVAPDAFHRHNQARRRRPYALSATATHDTKRGEDARARINVLSELPQEWRHCLSRWARLNKRHRTRRDGLPAPDRNDEYLFYQALIGAWPVEPYSPEVYAEFTQRMLGYMQKATHEAKVHTSWINPNAAYDKAVHEFVSRALDEHGNKAFLNDFRAFQRRISHVGLFNSLSQTLLKIASPGVSDVYQGTELWDFSLVDPDNRRPVDYPLRRRLLEGLQSLDKQGEQLPQAVRQLVEEKADGRIKMYLLWRALHFRRAHAHLLSEGEYLPAVAEGKARQHVVAFARQNEDSGVLVCVPRLIAGLLGPQPIPPLGMDVWADTSLPLPAGLAARRFQNLFTGETLEAQASNGTSALPVADIFANFPVALLVSGEW